MARDEPTNSHEQDVTQAARAPIQGAAGGHEDNTGEAPSDAHARQSLGQAQASGSWTPPQHGGTMAPGDVHDASGGAPQTTDKSGQGMDAPSHPDTQSGQEHAATKHDAPPAGKSDTQRRDLDAEKREPVQYGSTEPYQADEAATPSDRSRHGQLSSTGGSAGSGGGGADILKERSS